MATLTLGVLCSGEGTNLSAILDACAEGPDGAPPALDAKVAIVVCNREGAGCLARAERAGVPSRVLPHRGYPTREDYDAALVATLREAGASMVVLAGFMRLVTPVFLDAFPDRVLNLHPALLPSFPGTDGIAQALAYGSAVTGCTVHLVDAGVDTGPIVAQAVVPVLDDDTEATLHARVRAWEHRTLVEALRWFAEDRVRVIHGEPGQGGRVRVRVRVEGRSRAFFGAP